MSKFDQFVDRYGAAIFWTCVVVVFFIVLSTSDRGCQCQVRITSKEARP